MFDDLKPDIDYYMHPDGYRIMTKNILPKEDIAVAMDVNIALIFRSTIKETGT
jgi:hypothetical protein